MNHLSVAGLTLDFAGVMMLGIDLVRVQRKLKEDAEDRLATLDEVTESAGGLDEFLKGVSGDWRATYLEEGRSVPEEGTFDHRFAEASLDEIKGGISSLADALGTVASMMVAAVESDRKTAGRSLWVTYVGLGLISVGFLLQIPAYL